MVADYNTLRIASFGNPHGPNRQQETGMGSTKNYQRSSTLSNPDRAYALWDEETVTVSGVHDAAMLALRSNAKFYSAQVTRQ